MRPQADPPRGAMASASKLRTCSAATTRLVMSKPGPVAVRSAKKALVPGDGSTTAPPTPTTRTVAGGALSLAITISNEFGLHVEDPDKPR